MVHELVRYMKSVNMHNEKMKEKHDVGWGKTAVVNVQIWHSAGQII